jgi:2-iminobutanoate/2-iminopropanoate deaminase
LGAEDFLLVLLPRDEACGIGGVGFAFMAGGKVVVIEAALAEGGGAGVVEEGAEGADVVRGAFRGMAGVDAGGGADGGVLAGEGEGGGGGGGGGADGDEAVDAGVEGALEDGGAVGVEVGEVEVAMGVGEHKKNGCAAPGLPYHAGMSLEMISSSGAPAAVGPYSQAVGWEKLVYTAGQIPLDPATGELIAGDAAVQTRRVLQNLKAVLEAGGSGLGRVLKCTVFLTDLGDFAAMNGVYAEFFGGHKPARSTIQVAALPKGARVEIEAVAVRT